MMAYDDALLRKLTVHVRTDQSEGSGWIVPSENREQFYCLTAKHCVKGDNIRLTLLTDALEEVPLEYTDILRHPEEKYDLAILSVRYPAECYPYSRAFIGKVNRAYQELGLSGFPCCRRGALASFSGRFTNIDESNSILRLQLSNTNTSQADLQDQIVGVSGGGIFAVDKGNEYKLLAVETELADNFATFNELLGITLDAANMLLCSQGWPLLAKAKYRYASMLRGYNVQFKVKELFGESDWIDTKNSDSLIRAIQEHFCEKCTKPLLLCGLSGIGKTRIVLQACIQDSELSNALFFSSYEEFSQNFLLNLHSYSADSPHEPIYLIVDDVSFEEWDQLSKRLSAYNNFRAVAITEMGQRESTANTNNPNIMQMKPYDEDDVIEIIRNRFPALHDDELKSIFRLSDNDLRFASLIAEAYQCSPDKNIWSIHAQRSAGPILDRIMNHVVPEQYSRHVKIFSLFVDFGCEGTSKQELDFIKDYFGLSEPTLRAAIKLCEDQHLGIRRGNYFELSPRAFARLLFTRCHISEIKDFSDFMDRLPTDELRRRFILRASESSDETWGEVRDTLVSWFRKKYGHATLLVSSSLFGTEYAELSVGNTNEAMTYVEFIPDDGLKWMHNLIVNADDQALNKFLGRNGRREFVWTCEQLSCFQEHFNICEDILFTLSQHETERGLSNNSSGVWGELYGVLISNTEAPFKDRFCHLLDRMRHCRDDRNCDLFQSALTHALSTSGTRLLPPKRIGGRLTPENWGEQNIHTLGELWDIHLWILTTLCETANSLPASMRQTAFRALRDRMGEYTNNVILSHFPELYGQYRQALELFSDMPDQYSQIVIAINEQLGYEKIHSEKENGDFASNRRVSELTQWRDRIANTDLISRIKVCLAGNVFSEREELQERIRRLATELISSEDGPHLLEQMLCLDEVCDYNSTRFAYALGELDASCSLKDVIGENFSRSDNSFSEYYYFGVYDREKSLPAFILQELERNIERNPLGVLRVSVVCDFSEAGMARILGLLENGVINNCLLDLGRECWLALISPETMERILAALVKDNKRDGVFCFFQVGRMWLQVKPSSKLEDLLYRHMTALPFETRLYHASELVNLIELMPSRLFHGCINLVIQSIDYSHYLNTQTAQIRFIKKHVCGPFNREIAFEICDCLEAQFEQMSYTPAFSLLVGMLDPSAVLQWIEVKADHRAGILSYHLPAPSLTEYRVPEITLNVLERYGNDENVFRRFLSGIHAYEAYTLESVEQNAPKTFAVLAEYADYPLSEIRRWAVFEKERIDALIEEKKQLDSMHNRFYED